MPKDNFTFLRSLREALKPMDGLVRLAIYEAVADYSLDGIEPDFSDYGLDPRDEAYANSMWMLLRISVDNEKQTKERHKNLGEYGNLGGRPKKIAENNPKVFETAQEENPKVSEKENPKEITPTPPIENLKEKEKENSLIESKRKTTAANAATTDQRRLKFGEQVWSFKDKYPREMLHSFFDYWTELNRSRTKMRYETEKTWELEKRLAVWASRERVEPPPKRSAPAQPKTDFTELIKDSKTVKSEEDKRHELRLRLLSMVEAVRGNPESVMRGALENAYKEGTLQNLGINWKPD